MPGAGIVLALLTLVAALLAPTAPAMATEDVQPARAGGETRIETAAIVAGRAFPDGTDQAVIASALRFSDALAGASLAGALDAAMLLTTPERLEPGTADAIRALGVEQVTLLGGTDILQPAVEDDLTDMQITSERVGADEVYASAADIARATQFVAGDLPIVNGARTVAVASGEDFPDALAISGPAFELSMPLLLTEHDDIPAETAAVLDGFEPEHILLIGGADAVSSEVEARLAQGTRAQITRLGGINRTETATFVANHFFNADVFDGRGAVLARGNRFPDAVTAGQLSAFLDAPIVLTATEGLLGEHTGDWFADHCPTLELLQVVGGTDAVSTDVANAAENLAESCDTESQDPPEIPEPREQTFLVAPQQVQQVTAPATVDFTVSRRHDGQPLEGPLDLVLFPCEGTDVTGSGADTFADVDDDDEADGFATTDTGSARIAVVNGEDIADATIHPASPDEDGDIDIRLSSQSPDCTVLVVVDGNGNGALDLDAQNRPVEEYGVSKAEWAAG